MTDGTHPVDDKKEPPSPEGMLVLIPVALVEKLLAEEQQGEKKKE